MLRKNELQQYHYASFSLNEIKYVLSKAKIWEIIENLCMNILDSSREGHKTPKYYCASI